MFVLVISLPCGRDSGWVGVDPLLSPKFFSPKFFFSNFFLLPSQTTILDLDPTRLDLSLIERGNLSPGGKEGGRRGEERGYGSFSPKNPTYCM